MTRPPLEAYLGFTANMDSLLFAITVSGMAFFVIGARSVKPNNAGVKALKDRFFWVVIGIGALVFRLPLLTNALWYDETFTRRMVSIPLGDFLTALFGDVHPPGYYILTRITTSIFGVSDVAIRLPSLIAGLLIIPLVYQLARQVTRDKAVAQLAAAITMTLPAMSYYSTEARYPMILACLVLISLNALYSGRTRTFAVSTGLLVWFHNTGAVDAALLVIPALLMGRRWRWAVVGATGISGLWFPGLLTQIISGNMTNVQWIESAYPLWHVVDMTMRRGVDSPPLLLLTWGAPNVLSLFGLWSSRSWLRMRRAVLLIAIGAPALLWGIGLVWQQVYLPRVLIAPSLLLVITWAWFIIRARTRWRWVLIGVLAAALVVSNGKLYSEDRAKSDDVFDYCHGAQYIYTTSTNMTIMAMSYSDIPVIAWEGGNNLHQSLSMPTRLAMSFNIKGLATLSGEVCMVSQISYYTTDAEWAHIHDVRQRYSPAVTEIEQDPLFHYIVMRFTP